MSNGKGLEIIQQLLADAHIKERHQGKKPVAKPILTAEEQARLGLRYIRTPENDGRFNAGETYLDTETGRIRWMPVGVDPNENI